MKKGLILFFICLIFSSLAFGEENVTKSLSKRGGIQSISVTEDLWMDVNRMNGVMRNNGTWYYDNIAGDWGLEWPKGSGLSPIYGAGQYVSAKVDGEIRVAGVQHSATEFQPGMINEDGTATNPKDAAYQWYEIQNGSGDWDSWPVSQGAPVDEDGNPKLIGDRTAFCVWNDLAEHAEYGTKKLSVEVRQTVFAFNRADALGDMTFIKWQLVNKSEFDWDSTYFSIWMDPDIGDGTEDFVGCDPDLGLGYCYNATNSDQNYGTAPPAAGVDFFQGPIIDEEGSSVTLPDGTVLEDKAMLKMGSFVFYNNDDSPQGNPKTGNDVWNYQRGYWRDNSQITDPNGNYEPFMFNGDPETATGWLDSDESDRRFLMTTGPFVMDRWEDIDGDGLAEFGEPGVQEIVAGVICARGSSNLNSVTTLKTVDELAQMAYDLNFNLAKAPLPPNAVASVQPNAVVITWDETSEFNDDGSPYESVDPIVEEALGDSVIINNIETVITDASYNFYGYTVYQYSDASGTDPVKLASWNNGGVADAEDYSSQRFYIISTNKHDKVGTVGDPLINGKEYYFGVIAHGYCEFGSPTIFDSPSTILTVVPAYTPGAVYHASYQDTLEVLHAQGSGDGSATVWVVDPGKTTGLNYTVTVENDATWNLIRAASDTVAKAQTNQSGDDAYNVYDGLLVKVQGPPLGINPNRIGVAYGEGSETSAIYLTGWDFSGNRWIGGRNKGWPGFFGGLGNGADHLGTSLVLGTDYVDTELRFAGNPTGATAETTVPELAQMGKTESPELWSTIVIIDAWGSWGTRLGLAPFSAWDLESDPPRRLKLAIFEDALEDGGTPNDVWDMGWNIADSIFVADGQFEYIYILNDDYDEEYTWYLTEENNPIFYTSWPVMFTISPQARGDYPYLYDAFTMQIFASNVLTPEDKFTFTAPASAAATTETLKADLEKINVVPNPYYGYHSGEMDAFDRWVQFTYLPEKATIRIFDLAGNLIRILEKNDATTPYLRWDLENEYQLPVASGIYVYHVDVPNVGTKIGKLAVFSPNERLDTY